MPRGFVALALTLAVAASACDRAEAPAAGRPAKSTSLPRGPATAPRARPAAAKPPASAAPKQCVVPSPKESPPVAKKAESCPPDPTGNLDLPRGYVTFADAPGKPRVAVEVARQPRHRERGLMYRTSMPDDEGMLFSWDDERPRTFWMRNTCIPLDMLFIARDGTIVGIHEQVPTMNDDSRGIPCPAAHVLELNAGWCRSHGVVAGQKVEVDAP